MTLFSIAISTWLGLNIYNVIEKNEFESLKREVEDKKRDYEKSVDEFTEKLSAADNLIQVLKNDLTNMSKQQKALKENILEERISIFESNLNINNTWYKPFKALCHDNTTMTTFEILGYLTQVEKMYYEAYKADEQDDPAESLKYCKEGLLILEQCKKHFNNESYETSKSNPWFSFYLQIRESDFYYFMGNYYRTHHRDEQKSKENYIKELDILVSIDYLIKRKELLINDPYCIAKHYNTIATSYIFLMDFNDEHYDEYSVLAYKYSLLSIRSQYANSKAYRNFGVISERRQQFEQAEEAYRTSIGKNPKEYKSYLCLASLLLKQITKQLILESNNTYTFKNISISEKTYIENKLKEINTILNSGMSFSTKQNDFYNKLGWSYSYLYLLEDNPELSISYFNESEKQLKIANQLQPNLANKNLDRLYHIKEFKESKNTHIKTI